MKNLTKFLFCFLLLAAPATQAAPTTHRCKADALQQALKLLKFHSDNDERAEISGDGAFAVLSPIKNPANPKQQFDVLEVTGYIYKGAYRMRFIYAQMPNECVLMGQEILEFANL